MITQDDLWTVSLFIKIIKLMKTPTIINKAITDILHLKSNNQAFKVLIMMICLVCMSVRSYAYLSKTTIKEQSDPCKVKNEAEKTVTDFIVFFQSSDIEGLYSVLDSAIEWHQPGGNQVSGIKHSRDDVFEMFGKMFALSNGTLELTEVKLVTANKNEVACELSWHAVKPTGETLSIKNIAVYTVAEGRIIKAKIYTADQEAENRFWL